MRMKHIAAVIIVTAVLLFTQTYAFVRGEENEIPQLVDMTPVAEEPKQLYALSAVLMDGDSGRVLYEKNGETPLANASTTKVLTCIVALESAPGDDYVQVSQNAVSQSEVKLGLQKGEQYYLEDLLYSLMLKSHNDTAVAIAEHCGGTVEGFARMLNRKAKQIGCEDTYFITPNGLDAEDKNGIRQEVFSGLVQRIAADGTYEELILDVGGFCGGSEELLGICDVVYVPVKDDVVSTAKLEEWKTYLNRSGRSAVWEKLRFLKLPEPGPLPARESYLEQLLWSDLGDFVRELR